MRFFLLIIILTNSIFASDWKLVEGFDNTPTHIKTEVQAINCPNSNICYACVDHTEESIDESAWRLYKSTDNGRTWELTYKQKGLFQQSHPIIISVNQAISPHIDYYHTASIGYSVIQKSTDAGKTFEKILLDSSLTGRKADLRCFSMFDTLIGFVANSENIFITKTGWKSFLKIPKLHQNQTFYSSIFLDSNTVAMIYTSPWASLNDVGKSYLKYDFKSNTFDTVSYFGKEPGVWTDMIRSLFFVNDSIGFASGRRSFVDKEGYLDVIYKTNNGGKSWEISFLQNELAYPAIGLINNISFADEKNGIAVSYYGKIIMTNDGGKTWVYEEMPNEMDDCLKMQVAWAGRTPLIGTWGGGIFRYEGDFFDFPPDTAKISTENHHFGKLDFDIEDTLKTTLRIYNYAFNDDLEIISYSKFSNPEFSTSLPEVDSENPIVIKANDYYEYEVYFTANKVGVFQDSIVFHSNADGIDSVAYFTGEAVSYPKIVAENYDFGTCDIIDSSIASYEVSIENISTVNDLIVTGYTSFTDTIFSSNLPDIDSLNPIVISPNSEFKYTVYFKPNKVKKFKDGIYFNSNAIGLDNYAQFEGRGFAYPVIEVADYDFNGKNIFDSVPNSMELEIKNISSYADLIIRGYKNLSESVFTTDLPYLGSGTIMAIRANESYKFNVYFKPTEVRKYIDSIVFFTNSISQDSVLYLYGVGVDTVISVKEYNYSDGIEIYPNPARDYIEVTLNGHHRVNPMVQNMEIELFDVLGRNVEIEFKNEIAPLLRGGWGCVIDVSNLQPGIYFVRIGSEFLRFVKL